MPILIGGGGGAGHPETSLARFADVSNFAPHEWSGSAFEISDVKRKYAAL